MALNPIPIGDQIATYLYGNPLGAAGTPISLANAKLLWENIMTMIYNDIKATMDVLPTAHSGENLSSATGQPVEVADPDDGTLTGTVTADMECVGKGSVV